MGHRLNTERAAAILADAALNGDEVAAARWGVSTRVIRRYRLLVETNQELAASFHQKKAELERAWIERAAVALIAAVEFLTRAAREADPRNPEIIHAVAGALKILNEAILTSQVIDARLAHAYRRNGTSDRKVVAVDTWQRHAASG